MSSPASRDSEEFVDIETVDLSDEGCTEEDCAKEHSKEEAAENNLAEMDTSEGKLPEENATEDKPAGEGETNSEGTRGGRRRRSRRRRNHWPENFAVYFPRVLKNVQTGLTLSKQTVMVMNSFVDDIFQRIAEEAAHLVLISRRTTITCREIQTAVRLLLPGELGKHAVLEGTKALIRYTTSR